MTSLADVLIWKYPDTEGFRTEGGQLTGWPAALGDAPDQSTLDTWTAEYEAAQAAVTADQVQAECARRLALGFSYDFGDNRGVHQIGTTERDMAGWREVTDIANARINTSDTTQINIATETGAAQVTPLEWMAILKAAAAFRQPLWAASFTLQGMDPIPLDYTDNSYWT